MSKKCALKYNRQQRRAGHIPDSYVEELVYLGVCEFQEQHMDVLIQDGKLGPKTLLQLQRSLDPALTITLDYAPTGKGIYIRHLKSLGHPTALVAQALKHDISFVVIQSIWQDRKVGRPHYVRRPNSKDTLMEYCSAFREAGIEVWLWGYPYPGREHAFCLAAIADAEASNCVGFVLDPEKPYKRKEAAAKALVTAVTKMSKQHYLALGVTSYAATHLHRTFPYKEFSGVGWGSPQVYDKNNNLGSSYVPNSVNAWEALGWSTIVPSVPAYNKTPLQLKTHLHRLPEATKGVIFWDWKNLTYRKNRRLWDVIADLDL
tara:strand:- start:4807 stop:5757 length:951 start_codon:yes stop_codon:yes gene_type:complete